MSPYTSHTGASASVTPRGRGRTIFKYPTEEPLDCTPIPCKLSALSRVASGRVQKAKANPHPHEKEFQSHIRRGFYENLQMKYRSEPKGTCLGLIVNPVTKEGAYYIKDHFSGVVRPKIMKDDMYLNMTEAKLAEHRQRWEWEHGSSSSTSEDSDDSDVEEYDGSSAPTSPEDHQDQIYVDPDDGYASDAASSMTIEEDPEDDCEANKENVPSHDDGDDQDDHDGSGGQDDAGEDGDDEDGYDSDDYYHEEDQDQDQDQDQEEDGEESGDEEEY
ncbi:hypothetical protein ABKA04_005397 [Annulohypoxylon sp. FPYF3050]